MFSIFKHKSETFIADKLCAIDYIDFLRVIIVLAALAVEDTLAIAHAVLVGLCPPVSPLPRPGDAHSHNPLHTPKTSSSFHSSSCTYLPAWSRTASSPLCFSQKISLTNRSAFLTVAMEMPSRREHYGWKCFRQPWNWHGIGNPRIVQAEAARVDWQWQAGEASDHIREAQFRVPFEAGSVDQDPECGLLVGGSA
jgi:hypothetical protein